MGETFLGLLQLNNRKRQGKSDTKPSDSQAIQQIKQLQGALTVPWVTAFRAVRQRAEAGISPQRGEHRIIGNLGGHAGQYVGNGGIEIGKRLIALAFLGRDTAKVVSRTSSLWVRR